MRKDIWQKDFNNAANAVAPYVETTSDGFRYVGYSCPDGLSDLYARLTQVGYANGWMP